MLRRANWKIFCYAQSCKEICPKELKSTFNYCDMSKSNSKQKAQILTILRVKIDVWAYTP